MPPCLHAHHNTSPVQSPAQDQVMHTTSKPNRSLHKHFHIYHPKSTARRSRCFTRSIHMNNAFQLLKPMAKKSSHVHNALISNLHNRLQTARKTASYEMASSPNWSKSTSVRPSVPIPMQGQIHVRRVRLRVRQRTRRMGHGCRMRLPRDALELLCVRVEGIGVC
jgi:hypothetical protein